MANADSTVQYRCIPELPGYRFGDDGSVWSCLKFGGGLGTTWRRKSFHVNPQTGYAQVSLSKNGRSRAWNIAPLVLQSFVPKPIGMEVECCHNNGIKTDNRLDNLRWDTAQANQADSARHGTQINGSRSHYAKLSEVVVANIRERVAAGEKQAVIARSLNMSKAAICMIVSRENWKHVR